MIPLGDDDLLDPDFVETLLPYTSEYDVIYGWARMEGADWAPNRLFRADALEARNYIPGTALIRGDLLRELEYREAGLEDWDLWKRCLAKGARFKCVPENLWTYRIHGKNYFNPRRSGEGNAPHRQYILDRS